LRDRPGGLSIFAGGSFGPSDRGWGGRQTWLYAEHNPNVKAAVAWYGPLQRPKTDNTPANPPDLVKDLKVPVLGL
jgi:carboxymethylenebutenolidase